MAMTLQQLVAQLQGVYGADLVCVALYGSAARGEHLERYSDLNVLVVVEQITMEHLRKEAPIARAWRDGKNPPPMTLTRHEWVGSADIFPIEYSDILAHHKVLVGTLPIENVRVSRGDLRLQLEHEAMSKLLRLRHAMMVSSGDRRATRELLEHSVSTMLVLLRATLRLLGVEPPADSEAVCAQVMEHAGLDAAPVIRVVRHTRGKDRIADGEVEQLAERYLGTARALAHYHDAFDEKG